eukprot:GFYU01001126.1.p1 GENE.GFYU01001126.1~~GFYU01001126.1.p1  ORF type:complete len:742 (-),score=235.70 GFYU01001126.1:162-2387(-)
MGVFTVASAPNASLALQNVVCLHSSQKGEFTTSDDPNSKAYAKLTSKADPSKFYVLNVMDCDDMAPGQMGFNSVQRRMLGVTTNDQCMAEPYQNQGGEFVLQINIEVDNVVRRRGMAVEKVDAKTFNTQITNKFKHHVLTSGQEIVTEHNGTNIILRVTNVETCDINTLRAATDPASAAGTSSERGMLMENSTIILSAASGSSYKVEGGQTMAKSIFSHDFNFEKMGIGGLDNEFSQIFRRAFASRMYPSDFVQRLGIQHVKGMLLYGPPGTGKTLIARQIGKMLTGKEPKICNGPEVLDKYVGGSEEKIRKLFEDADMEYKERGDDSDLHIIIFDEIDAICKKRGSTRDGTGVHDSVVNQLLTKIDGVDSLNNILLIGMTNRKDMLDEALLRPGRLELHVQIGLPDEYGRHQILRIHTNKMVDNGILGEVDIPQLAGMTKNYSGAELESVVKTATSFAFDRQIDLNNLNKAIDTKEMKVTMDDFLRAVEEVRPAFGMSDDDFEACLRQGIVNSGHTTRHLLNTGRSLIAQTASSEHTLLSVLLEGPPGSGKTALAAHLAQSSEFPFVKMISPEKFVGLMEATKCGDIAKVFDDASKSPLSIIVLDDIERLLEYVHIGPRFSNAVLQTLLVLIKRVPPVNKKLLIIGTSSSKSVLENTELANAFNVVLKVPKLQKEEVETVLIERNVFPKGDPAVQKLKEYFHEGVAIKKLLLVCEMAIQASQGSPVTLEKFLECAQDCGV